MQICVYIQVRGYRRLLEIHAVKAETINGNK